MLKGDAWRNNTSYSKGRTTVAMTFAISEWREFSTHVVSSGTIADGTSRMADTELEHQREPMDTEDVPAGIARQAGGSDETAITVRADQTSTWMSKAIKNRFKGKPLESMCADVSSTAMAMVGAQ